MRGLRRQVCLWAGLLIAGLMLAGLGNPALARAHKHAAAPRAKAAAVAAKPAAAAVASKGIPATVVPVDDLLPDMMLGNPDAPVTVIEYASAACPHCAEWNKDVWPQFMAKYIATGKVRYIFREVLTNPQEYAMSAYLIGRCAVAQSKTPANATPYFTVIQSFFNGQPHYYETGQVSQVTQDVTKKTGLSAAAQTKCVGDGPQFTAFMKTMRTHMTQDNVASTPTFFINGKLQEKRELADFDSAIAEAGK